MSQPKTYSLPLADKRKGIKDKIKNCPSVHIARGYASHLPFLTNGRPLICISDWQYETATQEHFWEQAHKILCNELGGKEVVSRAIVLVAGDMASSDNSLRGVKSDDVPDLEWLRKSVPNGSVYMVYGNHDLISQVHLTMTNQDSGLPYLLPHGGSVPVSFGEYDERVRRTADGTQQQQPTFNGPLEMNEQERSALCVKPFFKKLSKQKKWEQLNPGQVYLTKRFKEMQQTIPHSSLEQSKAKSNGKSSEVIRIGSVHGIPAPHTEGMRKIEREEYFQAVHDACALPIDILVTHYNPKLPVHGDYARYARGEDSPRLYDCFSQSSAKLLVHGHMHSDPVLEVLENGKVVVNSDNRIVAFLPES